ncbi:MAG: 50S ribosomal protein L9 [Candidatus Tagabacteria bacterium RIFCSPLOWO2_01_FULL_39_11]|uniref:Large ribosomal subunit protein bL9 n=1 Tax=Candidatus Tagabacteria bacterium RIFCSPLOWO2_01_FULL_39_11 TaxID=1802295 RepID=A0A1G2LMW0_9BACT|nr:MAG: 50S ribosomal protein L9 [Candidatus Tagabacteria bacterium RIFCSPLOWO2_01_FULL_39_11]
MKVILSQNILNIGKKYEVKNVSDGYARNFLLPKKLAEIATPNALKNLQTRQRTEKVLTEEKEKLIARSFKKLKDFVLIIKEKANEKNQLFAGIDAERISQELKNNGMKGIDAGFIKLEKPIKKLGEYDITVEKEELKERISLNIKNSKED